MSTKQTDCSMTTIVFLKVHMTSDVIVLLRYTALEAIKSLFTLNLDQAFVPFYRSKVSSSIYKVDCSKIWEPAHVHYAVSWLTDASGVDVANA